MMEKMQTNQSGTLFMIGLFSVFIGKRNSAAMSSRFLARLRYFLA